MPKGIKGFQIGHITSEETRRKIGYANSSHFYFVCDYCGCTVNGKPSHYAKSKRHFCSNTCHANYVKEFVPKEEQRRFGTGYSMDEKKRRIKARMDLNHAIRDGKIIAQPCEICGDKAEAHHTDYDNPLDIRWLCFKHHRMEHKNAS